MKRFFYRLLRSLLGYLIVWGVVVVLLSTVSGNDLKNIWLKIVPQDSVYKNVQDHIPNGLENRSAVELVESIAVLDMKNSDKETNTLKEANAPKVNNTQKYIYIYQDGGYIQIPSSINKE